MTPLMINISTGSALRMRPAQRIIFEGALSKVSACMSLTSLVSTIGTWLYFPRLHGRWKLGRVSVRSRTVKKSNLPGKEKASAILLIERIVDAAQELVQRPLLGRRQAPEHAARLGDPLGQDRAE